MLISNYCVAYFRDGFIFHCFLLADSRKDAIRKFRAENASAVIDAVYPCNRYRV